MKNKPAPLWLFPLLALLMAAGHIYLASTMPTCMEDAYITFRYARNLANGLGLVYNQGQHVMGYTSPFWAIWSALSFKLHIPIEYWARGTNLACELGILYLLRGNIVFSVLYATSVFFAGIASMGIESSLFLLAVVSACLAPRWWVIGLLPLIRPEGALVSLILLPRLNWKERAGAFLIPLTFYLPAWAYYGSPIPQSVSAKASTYGLHWFSGWNWVSWIIPFHTEAVDSGEGIGLAFSSVLTVPAAILGAMHVWKKRLEDFTLIAIGILFWIVYFVTGTQYFPWYFPLPLAAFFLLVSYGLPRMVPNKLVWIILIAFLPFQFLVCQNIYRGRWSWQTYRLQRPAQQIRKECRPGESILLEPIGVVGYWTDLKVIDEVGLVTLGMEKHYPGWYADAVRKYQPDWLLCRVTMTNNKWFDDPNSRPFRDSTEMTRVMQHYAVGVPFGNPENPNTTLLVKRR